MRQYNFPIKDASVYSEFSNRNTGLDEILEVGKTGLGNYSVRSLLQFTVSSSAAVPINASYDLVLFVANAEHLKPTQKIEICQISQSWEEGTGYLYQVVTSSGDGVTWTHCSGTNSWSSGSAGGSYLTSSLFTSSLGFPLADLTIDVTTFVRSWISGTVQNNGLLLKFPTVDESDVSNDGIVKFFSNQTHTIYRPALVARWDDQSYVTGTLSWPTASMYVKPVVKNAYRVNEVVRVDVAVRERFPLKTFDSASVRYVGERYLPSSSYYSIVDDLSGTTIIPFSSESKISVSGNTNYFTFRVAGMYPLRRYRVLVKVDHNGLEEIFDDNTIFSVK